MSEKKLSSRIQQKHDTEANWLKATNFTPRAGELIIYDVDNMHSTPRFKVGDGSTSVSDLPFVNGTMKFDADGFSYEDYGGNIGTFSPTNIILSDLIYKAAYDTTSISYKNISTDVEYDLNFPTKSGTFAVTSDIDVTAGGNNTFTGVNTFKDSSISLINTSDSDEITTISSESVVVDKGGEIGGASATLSAGNLRIYNGGAETKYNMESIYFDGHTFDYPSKDGTLALTSDIDVTATGNNIFTGTNQHKGYEYFYNGVTASDGSNLSDVTTLKYNCITRGSSALAATYSFPSNSGTLALTSNIDITAASNNTFTGTNTFQIEDENGSLYRTLINKDGVSVGGGPAASGILIDVTYGLDNIKRLYGGTTYTYTFPNKSSMLATMDDIPIAASLAKVSQDNTFTGKNLINTDPVTLGGLNRYKTIDFSNYDSIKVGWKQSNTLDSNWYNYTRYADGVIYRSATGTGEVSLTLPVTAAGGTLALTSDIPIKSASLDGTTLSITLS